MKKPNKLDLSLTPIKGPHLGLKSSSNLLQPKEDDSIVGIWLQAIDDEYGKDKGRIMAHDHGQEDINEIIIIDNESMYAGLPPACGKFGEFNIHFVPSGFIHGSDTQASYGRWISIKIKNHPST